MAVLSKANATIANTNKSVISSSPDIIVRELGKTGIKVPVVSMGCGRIDSPAVLKAALKLGITHFDTAAGYQGGNSESLLGEVLKEYPRESYTVATKIKAVKDKDELMNRLEESLARLKMSYVDILYLHSISTREDALNEELLAALKVAKESEKVKHVGLSTHKNEVEVIQAAIDSDVYEVVLSSVNFKQEHYPELKEKIALATQKGIGIVAMKVMAGGFLDKERKQPVNYTAALKWVLQDENVHTTIPGIVNLEQLQENASILKNITLTEQEKNDLKDAGLQAGLYCNGCSTCTGKCVKNLPVPEIMRAYMYAYGYQQTQKARDLLVSLDSGPNPCADCTICSASCVKGFDIAGKIMEVSRLTDVPTDFLV